MPLAAPTKLHIDITLDTGDRRIDEKAVEQVLGVLRPLLRMERHSKVADNNEQGR